MRPATTDTCNAFANIRKYKDGYDHFQYEIYLVVLQILRCRIVRLEASKVTLHLR